MILGAFVLIIIIVILVVALKPSMCGMGSEAPQQSMCCSGAPVDMAERANAPFPVLAASSAPFERDLAPIISKDGQLITEAPDHKFVTGKVGEGFETFKDAPEGIDASMWASGAVGGSSVPGGSGTVSSTLNRYAGAMTQQWNLRARSAGMSERNRASRFGANTNPLALAGQALGITDSRGATAPLQMSSATNLGLPDGHPALEGLVHAGASSYGLPDGHPNLERLVPN